MAREEIFIKNVMFVDSDGLRGICTYTINAMFNVPRTTPNGFEYYEIEHRLIDNFAMTWDEIESWGGVAAINRELKEDYNL